MLAELLRGATAERLADIAADPRFGGWLPSAHPPMGAFIGVPVVAGGEVSGIIYRVAQEALHNALRHSGGHCVTISVSGAARGSCWR